MKVLLRVAILAAAMASLLACDDDGDDVDRAARVSRAIQAEPHRAEAILEEEGMTIEELEALMYEIAADPEASERYRAATEGGGEE